MLRTLCLTSQICSSLGYEPGPNWVRADGRIHSVYLVEISGLFNLQIIIKSVHFAPRVVLTQQLEK